KSCCVFVTFAEHCGWRFLLWRGRAGMLFLGSRDEVIVQVPISEPVAGVDFVSSIDFIYRFIK
ncbi:hypothetical protein Q6288_27750, partial [Klebsiella quasipneumoniae]|uniref:hypothetical protein n=1 Tax=Klebsiella quasipneumoniae TaxID=1463165 RepID=UPI00272F0FE5